IVVLGTLRLIGYDFDSGKELWSVNGLSRIANMTPAVGGDGNLYVAAWAPGADPGERINVEPWEKMLEKHDANKNGTREPNEAPAGPLKERFTQIDRDKDGHITKEEYEGMRRIFLDANNLVFALKPGGKGDITKTHVLWKYEKMLPYIPSPLYYEGHLFYVK